MSTRWVRNGGSILFPRHHDDKSREAGAEVKCLFPGCGMTFVDKNALLRHGRTHVPAEVYVCPACGRGEVKAYPLPHGHWRWSCTNLTCNSDFGYNTPKPLLD